MVNLWGPGAFDSLNPAASRPIYVPSNAPGDVDDWFKDCSDPLTQDGTEWRSALLNALIANLRTVVTGSGVTKSNLDDALLAKAIQSGGMNFAVATGTANNWTVALNLALTTYRAGRVLWLKAPATNTNATVVVTIDGLAARPIKKADGSNLAARDLVGGTWYPTIDDGTSICVVATLPSDIAAQKTLTNIMQLSYSSRAVLSTTGFLTYQSGTYAKRSATSDLVIEMLVTLADGGVGATATVVRLSFGVNSLQGIAQNNQSGQARAAAGAKGRFQGVGAGNINWTLELGRGDATAWSSVINPTSTDFSFLPNVTTTTIMIAEIEP